MYKEPIEYLKHIHEESKFILSIMDEGITKEGFLKDERVLLSKFGDNW